MAKSAKPASFQQTLYRCSAALLTGNEAQLQAAYPALVRTIAPNDPHEVSAILVVLDKMAQGDLLHDTMLLSITTFDEAAADSLLEKRIQEKIGTLPDDSFARDPEETLAILANLISELDPAFAAAALLTMKMDSLTDAYFEHAPEAALTFVSERLAEDQENPAFAEFLKTKQASYLEARFKAAPAQTFEALYQQALLEDDETAYGLHHQGLFLAYAERVAVRDLKKAFESVDIFLETGTPTEDAAVTAADYIFEWADDYFKIDPARTYAALNHAFSWIDPSSEGSEDFFVKTLDLADSRPLYKSKQAARPIVAFLAQGEWALPLQERAIKKIVALAETHVTEAPLEMLPCLLETVPYIGKHQALEPRLAACCDSSLRSAFAKKQSETLCFLAQSFEEPLDGNALMAEGLRNRFVSLAATAFEKNAAGTTALVKATMARSKSNKALQALCKTFLAAHPLPKNLKREIQTQDFLALHR